MSSATKTVLGLLLASMLPAQALEVVGYSAAANDRFESGFPERPVPSRNPAFVGAAYDLSGVGWDANDCTHSVALISPRHFLCATHLDVGGAGKALHFVSRNGVLKRCIIARIQPVPFAPDAAGKMKQSDLSVGTLTEPISPSEGITHYRVLFLGREFSRYSRQRLLVYGHRAKLGMNEVIDGQIVPGEMAQLKFRNEQIPGLAKTESGDSGSPTFLPYRGELTIVGTHSEICVDTFVPAFIVPLGQILAADKESIGVIDASKR